MSAQTVIIAAGSPLYPKVLSIRLGNEAPANLFGLGNVNLLALPKIALFCSSRCPGDAILRTHDQAAQWRDTGRCVISGFHSPVEKECLRILLRGRQPIIISPARGLPKRLAPELRDPFDAGRLLLLTPFPATMGRVTAELAASRNRFVAALADEVWFAAITPGGELERLSRQVSRWGAIHK